MSKFLQKLIDAREPMFTAGLKKLEQSTGYSAIDVRLIADVTEKTHSILRRLRLDTVDTTAREVYYALIETIHDKSFEDFLLDDDYVMFSFNGDIISFNVIDIIENAHHKLKFEKRTISHGRRSLRGELLSRYIDHPTTDNNTVKEIASDIGLLFETDEWYNMLKASRYKKTKQKILVV